MKKHRKVGNKTDTNFFTSEFKLKSPSRPKENKHRKMNTTFSNFRHQLLNDQQSKNIRQNSHEQKPIIQQLKFIVNNKHQNFKLPQTMSKRSMSKGQENHKHKLQVKNNQLFQEKYMEIIVKDEKKHSAGYISQVEDLRKYRPITVKNVMKQKLQKSALQKFKDAISKENEENQNLVSEEKAEALYQMLKTSRKSNQWGRNCKQLRYKKKMDQMMKYRSVPSQSQQPEEVNNINKIQYQAALNNQLKNGSTKNNTLVEPTLFKKNEGQPSIYAKQRTSAADRNKLMMPPRMKDDLNNFKSQNIQQKINRLQNHENDRQVEHFQQSSRDDTDSHKSETQINQKIEKQIKNDLKKNKNMFEQKIEKQVKPQFVGKESKQSKKELINTKTVLPQKRQQRQPEQKLSQQQKSIKNVESNASIQAKLKQQKYAQDIDIFKNIEEANVVDAKQIGKKQSQKSAKTFDNRTAEQKQYVQIDSTNKIQKLLTTQFLQKNKIQQIGPPPKLKQMNVPKHSAKQYNNSNDEEIQQIELGGAKGTKNKKQSQLQSLNSIKVPPQPIKPRIQTSNIPTGIQKAKTKISFPESQIEAQPQQIPPQSGQQANQSDDFGPLDELIYYIQRMQDIGQYRMNSKDLYNDKSIDKQLIQTHKICAYYMSHQFLYLTKAAHILLKQDKISKDYYNISAEQLNELKKNGEIDSQLQNIEADLEESKKLLRKCYDQCKTFLKKQEQILLLDGRNNYHMKCCSEIIKQFKKIYALFEKNKQNQNLVKRCCYLIQIYCVLKMFNGEDLKQYEQYEDIQKPLQHIKTYKKLVVAQ